MQKLHNYRHLQLIINNGRECWGASLMGNDLIVKGASSSSGGQFDKVVINGSGKINGNLECEKLECSGKGNILGDLVARKIELDGNCKVTGQVTSEELEVKGVAKVDGHSKITEIEVDGRIVFCDELESSEIDVDGECKVFGNMQTKKLNINGFLSVGRNCEGKQFSANGKVNIGGRLTAETIDIKLFWDSKAEEICAHKVVVDRVDKFWVKLVSIFIRPSLQIETIEADEVDISLTKAKLVRGKDITIGDRCEIDLVEYTGDYTCSPKAKVGNVVKK